MDARDNDEAILPKENVSELHDIPQISYDDVSKEIVVHDKSDDCTEKELTTPSELGNIREISEPYKTN